MFRGSVKGTGYTLPFASFPFISLPVRHRVPSHFNWTLHRTYHNTPCRHQADDCRECGSGTSKRV